MEAQILQISDIHLKGDQNGVFDVQGNLDAVIADASNQRGGYDLIALTGDLVDNGTVDDYTNLFEGLLRAFMRETFTGHAYVPIIVTPGNHDNREALAEAFAKFRNAHEEVYDCNRLFKFKFAGSFKVPGQAVSLVEAKINSSTGPVICTMDTAHKAYPVEGLFNLLAMNEVGSRPMTVFTHMPLVRPFHRFMNQEQYTLPNNYEFVRIMMKSAQARTVCCGHYHHASTTICHRTGLIQYVAPATQMQIDPYTKDFNASGMYPGYNIVLVGLGAATVETRFVIPEQKAKGDPKDEA